MSDQIKFEPLTKGDLPAGYFEQEMISPITGAMGSGYDDTRSHGQHMAGDLTAPAGTPVVAPGNMEFVDGRKGGKNLRDNDYWSYWRDTDTGVQYRFAHHGDISKYKPGDRVAKGEQWNVVGDAIKGTHLHMAVVDPEGKHVNWMKPLEMKRGEKLTAGETFGQIQAQNLATRAGKVAGPGAGIQFEPLSPEELKGAQQPKAPIKFTPTGPPPAATQQVSPEQVQGAGGQPQAQPTEPETVPGGFGGQPDRPGLMRPPPPSIGQKVAGAVAPVAKPILEFGGLTAGALLGGGSAGPIGAVAGAGLGYGAGKQAARALDIYGGGKKPGPPGEALAGAGKDVATGAAIEMGGQIAGVLAKPVGEWIASKGSRLYESALKIPPSVPAEIRNKAVQIGIEGKYLPKQASLDRLGTEMKELGGKVDIAITRAAKTGAEVDTKAVLDRVDELGKFYENLPDPRPYMQQLQEAKSAIMEYRGDKIPVDVAQKMKKNLYTNLRKSYGEMKSISKEFDKSVARGIKEELETQIPELGQLNKNLSDKINLNTVLERAVHRVRNYDVIRLGDTVAAVAGGAATQSVEGMGLGYMVKRVLEAPTVKARLAFALQHAAKINAPTGTRAALYGMSKVDMKSLRDTIMGNMPEETD